MINISVGMVPPTSNTAYGRNKQGRRYLSDAGKHYKTIVMNACFRLRGSLRAVPHKLVIEVHKPWYTKKGAVAKNDISNRVKIAEDALMQGLGLDDCYIFEIVAKKVQSETLKTSFSLMEISS